MGTTVRAWTLGSVLGGAVALGCSDPVEEEQETADASLPAGDASPTDGGDVEVEAWMDSASHQHRVRLRVTLGEGGL